MHGDFCKAVSPELSQSVHHQSALFREAVLTNYLIAIALFHEGVSFNSKHYYQQFPPAPTPTVHAY